MSRFNFKGVITALATPFQKGALDMSSFKKLIKQQLDSGIQGFVVGGTTGESPTLHSTELKELVRVAQVEVGKQVPIIVGTGANSTPKTVEATRLAAEWGADAALVVTPYYNKPPQRGLMEHFLAVQSNSTIPLILYNVPSRTVTELTLDTIKALSKVDRIVGIKEATGKMKFAKSIVDNTADDFLVLSGDDATAVDMNLLKGDGVISVISHIIPKQFVSLIERAQNGDKSAVAEYKKFSELLRLLYVETNPIPLKTALYQMGIFASPELRLPMVKLADEHVEPLRACLTELGVIA